MSPQSDYWLFLQRRWHLDRLHGQDTGHYKQNCLWKDRWVDIRVNLHGFRILQLHGRQESSTNMLAVCLIAILALMGSDFKWNAQAQQPPDCYMVAQEIRDIMKIFKPLVRIRRLPLCQVCNIEAWIYARDFRRNIQVWSSALYVIYVWAAVWNNRIFKLSTKTLTYKY